MSSSYPLPPKHTPADYTMLFDFYMERGSNGSAQPPASAPADQLGDYVEEVADEPGNRRLMEADELWRDIIRDSLEGFCGGMINAMGEIDSALHKEAELLDDFFSSPLERKREMWGDVVRTLKGAYSPEEVNVDGYSRLMKENPEDVDDIFDALRQDWQKALMNRADRLKQQLIDANKKSFEQGVREAGSHDYAIVSRTEAEVGKYPQLREILSLMGRDKEKDHEEYDATVTRYIPQVVSNAPTMSDIDGVTTGSDLRNLLPSELTRLDTPGLDTAFLADFAAGRLQLFSSKPPTESREKTENQRRRRPRQKEGPMIVCVDTSFSMAGKPERIAKALVMQILRVAKTKRRKLFLITYSVRSRNIELTSRKGFAEVKKFMAGGFTGGTNGEMMLGDVIKALNSKNFSMADVLIISDFEFPRPVKPTLDKIKAEQAKGTRFYGLAFRSGPGAYEKILDRAWKI